MEWLTPFIKFESDRGNAAVLHSVRVRLRAARKAKITKMAPKMDSAMETQAWSAKHSA